MDEGGRFWGQTSVCVCVELAWKKNIEHQLSTNQHQATTAGAAVRLLMSSDTANSDPVAAAQETKHARGRDWGDLPTQEEQ